MSTPNDHIDTIGRKDNGYTKLMSACHAGKKKKTAELLQKGANPNLALDDGNTCLHLAAKSRIFGVMTLLLNNKADPWQENNQGETAFSMEGFSSVHPEAYYENIISYCCKIQDENPKAKAFLQTIYSTVFAQHYKTARLDKDARAHTPLLAWAAAMGHLEEVDKLLAVNRIDANTTDMGHGRTALRMACKNSHLDVVKRLLEEKADPNILDDQGYAPLDFALAIGRDDMIEVLRRAGAKPTSKYLNRALLDACKNGDVHQARRLLANGANPNINEPETETYHVNDCPLTYAGLDAKENQAELIQLLLEYGANIEHPSYNNKEAWMVIRINKVDSPANPILLAAHNAKKKQDSKNQQDSVPLTNEEQTKKPSLACDRLIQAVKKEFQTRRKFFLSERSRMKYKMVSEIIKVLEKARQDGKDNTDTVEGLFNYKVSFQDLGITESKQKKLYSGNDGGETSLKEVLEFHRAPGKKRSPEFFKKPSSAQNILGEFSTLKMQAIDFLTAVRVRLQHDKRKGDVTDKMKLLYDFMEKIKDSQITSLDELLKIQISRSTGFKKNESGSFNFTTESFTLLQALQLARESKDRGKDTRSFKDFCKQFHLSEHSEFADLIQESRTPVASH